jgi:TetR/AcrR family transcriptional regulator of autoinduction and epiphytic fitness
MKTTTLPLDAGARKRELILDAAIPVFGRFGFKKTSIDDLAEAAEISKQGLYLHFPGKEALFVAAMQKYLDDGLGLVRQALAEPGASLFTRLLGAMDAWFGRHYATFVPASLDVIETGNRMSGAQVDKSKAMFRAALAKALADSTEFQGTANVCSPKEIAEVLFLCGLTWKEGHVSRADFMKKIALCIRTCCQLER